MKKSRANADRIVSVSAILLSLATLIMIMYQTNLKTQEQKASVMPYLDISFSNGSVQGAPYQQLQLSNSGLGPAIIDNVEITRDGQTVSKQIIEHLRMEHGDSIMNRIYSIDLLQKGRMLEAEDRLILVRFDNSNQQDYVISTYDFGDRMKFFVSSDQMGDSKIRITYSNVYGDQWVISTDQIMPQSLDD